MKLTDWLPHPEALPFGLTKETLESIKAIAKKLDIIDFSGKIIIITGTNGKGSTTIFLESILLAAGLKVGAYISPHVLNYNERIRIDGKEVDDKTLYNAFELVEKIRGDTVLSYFEFSTLAALVIFKNQNPDVLILEVGLGGRLDAVNIVDSDIAIITTVALEHTQILGNTREAIGYEKSGIMRPSKPVICGENMPKSVYEMANKLGSKLYSLNNDFFYTQKNGRWNWYFGETIIENLPLPCLPLPNAALALMAVKLLSKDLKISQHAIFSGLKNAFLLGRFQRVVFAGREIILDVAHNPEATSLLALNLAHKKARGRTLAVVSMLKDKDIVASFIPMLKVIDRWFLGVLSGDRAATGVQLTLALQQAGCSNFELFPSIMGSFKQAIAECQEKDRIVVFGSFHTVAECLKIIKSQTESEQ